MVLNGTRADVDRGLPRTICVCWWFLMKGSMDGDLGNEEKMNGFFYQSDIFQQ